MSYSRWSNSRWYTYWHAIDSKYADEQILSVDCDFTFSYLELKEDVEACIQRVRDEYKKREELETFDLHLEDCTWSITTEAEFQELKGYMLEFVNDVKDYKDLIFDDFEKDPEGRRVARSEW